MVSMSCNFHFQQGIHLSFCYFSAGMLVSSMEIGEMETLANEVEEGGGRGEFLEGNCRVWEKNVPCFFCGGAS